MTDSESFHPVVIAPTFDNARTLARVLSGVSQIGLPAIVIDDGCIDGSAGILQAWQQGDADRVVLTHPANRGKAEALLDGFERALEMGFTHAITVDTDGQLDPAEIPKLLRVARSRPTALVVGCRDAEAVDCPAASRWGRRASNLLIGLESGARISDSQCGFRVYPLRLIKLLKCSAGRYGFESEILTRAAWAGVPIEQLNVNCIYDVPGGRVSHFRMWRDSLAVAVMHLRLLGISFVPRPELRVADGADTGKIWLRLARWISPIRFWRDLRCDPKEHTRFATAFAAGVFIANLPLYGVQTLLSLFVARRFRLNPVAVVIGSSISTPPVGPLLIAGAIGIGNLCIHGSWPQISTFDPRTVGYVALVKTVLLEWTIGGIICGTVLALATYCLAWLALQWTPVHTQANSADGRAAPAKARDLAIPESVA
jgi:glycosyltransferase involved in cell wall biosynthesis